MFGLSSTQILLCLIFYFVDRAQGFTDIYVDSVRVLNESSTIPGYGNCTLKRKRQSNPTITADIWQTDNLKNYEIELKMFYSRLGNNRYILLPFKFKRSSFCDYVNVYYRKYTMHELQKYSNFAYSDDPNVDLCELSPPPGHLWVRNFEINSKDFSKYHPTGRYRFLILFYKKNEKYSCKGVLAELVIT